MCGCLSRAPYWQCGLQPRRVPSLGIKLENWESDWRPFGLQAGTQSTEPHQPELTISSYNKY